MVRKHLFINSFIVLVLVFAVIGNSKAASESNGANEEASSEYKLVWAEEFNKNGAPDPCNWTYERGFVRNQELQWYQSENAKCENGLLVIEGKREKNANPRYNPNSNSWQQSREFIEYTSTSMTTRGLHSWMYGRFEMRGRIDTRAGLWPAFWTLGVQGPWPANGEVDIMEYYRGVLLANAAWAGQRRGSATWDSSRKPITEFNDPNWSDKFHVWRMDWDVNDMKLYVDDMLLNEVDLTKTINAAQRVSSLRGTSQNAQGDNPFHQPHYIILNLAIGGTQGGDPSKTEFPAKFEVDYVRIYQKE